jgi:hypothetical protein
VRHGEEHNAKPRNVLFASAARHALQIFFLCKNLFPWRIFMKLSLKAIAISGALVWGGAILLVGLINLSRPGYGLDFLQMTSSVYPWFHDSHTLSSVLIGTIDGLVDGAVAALTFAAIYNGFATPETHSQSQPHTQS